MKSSNIWSLTFQSSDLKQNKRINLFKSKCQVVLRVHLAKDSHSIFKAANLPLDFLRSTNLQKIITNFKTQTRRIRNSN
jgi:hypothetical protein